ncbi:sigma factor [Rhodanobacter sp. Col0626]|uniref:sigma factor n=1 Tax=Rhodanobacter sp. Col0626 TaxID=3415679 RepID=UPI003CF460C3
MLGLPGRLSPSHAEDVQQEVFLRLLERPVGQIASWPAYLTTLAVRMAIDRLRNRQRWRRLLTMWRAAAPAAFDSTERASIPRIYRFIAK